MQEISVEHLMELYIDTLDKCGTYLLHEEDELIEYNIFEEFDTGIISFLHIDSLERLHHAGLINKEIFQQSARLRELVLKLQHNEEWNLNAVKHSPAWMEVLMLTDNLREKVKYS